MVNNEPTTQAIAVSLGIEVMKGHRSRTCEVAVILVLGWESERGPRGPGWLISLRQRLALRDRPPSADSGTRESAWSPRRCAVCGLHARCAARRGAGRRGAGGTACMVVRGSPIVDALNYNLSEIRRWRFPILRGPCHISAETACYTRKRGPCLRHGTSDTSSPTNGVVLQIRWHADEASGPLRTGHCGCTWLGASLGRHE